ncbi:hypothetical protein BDZ89DRAFT_239988 [Hymenopellis radicata]|nr:hypothetical protein BDZ89DRAFT_239988 [Hymenopellis radicata]
MLIHVLDAPRARQFCSYKLRGQMFLYPLLYCALLCPRVQTVAGDRICCLFRPYESRITLSCLSTYLSLSSKPLTENGNRSSFSGGHPRTKTGRVKDALPLSPWCTYSRRASPSNDPTTDWTEIHTPPHVTHHRDLVGRRHKTRPLKR